LVYFKTTFSNILNVVDKRLIGRKLCGNLGSLHGFGNGITSVPSKTMQSAITEYSGEVNDKDLPMVFLEGA
jgi:hypothetical protein